jgi:Fur family transcriptional regulator, iron response regulator
MKQSSFRRLEGRPGPKGGVFLWPSSANATGRLKAKLFAAGLLPTKPRLALCGLLFTKRDRHVTAEMLFEEAKQARITVSLATVYNTLRQFIRAGLLRPLAIDGTKLYFDTNVSNHHHFYLEDQCQLVDMPANVRITNMPAPPKGYAIDRIRCCGAPAAQLSLRSHRRTVDFGFFKRFSTYR